MSHHIVSAVLVLGATFVTWPAAADPTKAQCIASNDHAQEFRQAGKLSKAREQLLICVAQSCPGPVREDCAQRLDELDKAMPTIVFTWEGHPGVTKRLVLAEHDQARREVIVFGNAETPHVESASPGAAPVAAGSGGSGIDRKTIAFAVGGAGVAGLVVGSIFGAVASSKWSAAKSDCGAGCGPTAPAQGEKSTASSDATISTVAFVVGGVLAAGGVVLYLTAPSRTASGTGLRIAPALGSNETGVVLAGGF
jgi:hypothetical protein